MRANKLWLAPLAVAIIVFPKAFEDFGGGEARGILNRRIAVDERQAQPLGQPPADRRLASPHQADEYDWTVETLGEFMHAQGYTALAKVGKSPI